MTSPRPITGWSLHAPQVAWFEAWLRAVRSHKGTSAVIAQTELLRLGIEVRAVTRQVRQ